MPQWALRFCPCCNERTLILWSRRHNCLGFSLKLTQFVAPPWNHCDYSAGQRCFSTFPVSLIDLKVTTWCKGTIKQQWLNKCHLVGNTLCCVVSTMQRRTLCPSLEMLLEFQADYTWGFSYKLSVMSSCQADMALLCSITPLIWQGIWSVQNDLWYRWNAHRQCLPMACWAVSVLSKSCCP